jgi:nitrogen fixation protein FixH
MGMRTETRRDQRADGGWRFTGWMALAILVGFFGVMLVANGSLVYYALSTFSGEQEASPYEHGLAYDKDIAAAREQEARQWRVSVKALRPNPGAPASIDVAMRDAQNAPLEGLKVNATLEFPADKKLDARASLKEAAPGEYRADAVLAAGQWDLVIEARRNGERLFRSVNRIVLR